MFINQDTKLFRVYGVFEFKLNFGKVVPPLVPPSPPGPP